MNITMNTNNPIPARNFWLALGAQLLLIATVPAQALYTLNTGTTVYLKTAPVDPVDLLRGYYQTLGYEISNKDTLQKLSGGGFMMKIANGQEIFVTLALPASGERAAAKPIAISLIRPPTKPQEVVLRGVYSGWQVKYDLEQFYMPEQQQVKVNQDIDRGRRSKNLLMETKIGKDGRGLPVAIWIGDQSYRF
jgi:uncharacterized membrane-anchored protein